MIAPDAGLMAQHLNQLFKPCIEQYPDGLIEIRCICPDTKAVDAKLFEIAKAGLAAAVDFAGDQNTAGKNVYVGVNPRKPGTRRDKAASAADVEIAFHCFGDLDSEESTDRLLEFLANGSDGLRYSFAVTTGETPSTRVHVYWALEEPACNLNSWRDVQRRIATHFAGDSVIDPPRIMRLAGTVSYPDAKKIDRGYVSELVTIRTEYEDDRDPVSFEALRQRFSFSGKSGIKPVGQDESDENDNPFITFGDSLDFKPAIDVEKALLAMSYAGTGDAGIHQTQLRVSASMIARGQDDDEIVEKLLAATRVAAGEHGKSWDWVKEEQVIRKMIATGRNKKYGTKRNVVDISKAREERAAANGTTSAVASSVNDQDAVAVQIARITLGVWEQRHGPIMLTGGSAYTYAVGIWQEFDDELEQRLRACIQEACRELGRSPTNSNLNGAWRWIMENPDLLNTDVKFDSRGVIVTNNGALDPLTGDFGPHRKEHFATFRIDCDYDPEKISHEHCPTFMAMLCSMVSDYGDEQQQSISTILEWMGAALVKNKPRALRKALMIFGPSGTGKTQLANVMRALVGGKPCGLRASELGRSFGAQPLVNASAWIADDAVSANDDLDPEWFKVIITGEAISIPRKNRTNWEGRLDIPVMLTTNNLPKVRDQSDAVFNRSLLMPLTVHQADHGSFDGYQDISGKVIAEELGSVLGLVVRFYNVLRERTSFDPPERMVHAQQEFKDSNATVAAWMRQALMLDETCKVDQRDIYASYQGFVLEEFGEFQRPMAPQTIYKIITSEMPKSVRKRSHGKCYFTGVRLTEDGHAQREAVILHYAGTRTIGSGKTGNVNEGHGDTRPESKNVPMF